MKTIEIIGTVEPGGKLTLQLPADIPAGNHRMVLSIEESPTTTSDRPPAPSDREDPILGLGSDPIELDLSDAAENHDRYLYTGQ